MTASTEHTPRAEGPAPRNARSDLARDRRRALIEAAIAAGLLLATVTIGTLGLMSSAMETIRTEYREHLMRLATAAAQSIDVELHARLRDPAQIDTPDYARAVAPLRRLRASVPDLKYIYTVIRDGRDVRFILDAADPGDHDGDGIEDRSGVGEVYLDHDAEIDEALGTGNMPGHATASRQPATDKWGTFITGYAPFYEAAGRQAGVVGVDMNASVFLARLNAARDRALLGVIPAALVIVLLSGIVFVVRVRALTAGRARSDAIHALEQSERKFRGLFELSPVGIALNDYHSAQFLEVNDALLAPTGYSREELLRLNVGDLTPETFASQGRAHHNILETSGRYGPYEKEYIRKDGTRYPVLLNGMRMTDASGREVIWSIVQDISRRKAMELELTTAAYVDRLTGLANRATFVLRLQRAIERVHADPSSRFAVLFLDFDRFKLVNDSLGHDAGDRLLQQIAERLCSTLRASDVMGESEDGNLVARFGGDEFIVLLRNIRHAADAEKVAERLLNVLAPAYPLAGREVHSSASIGIVTSEQCSESADAVIRNADVAMYEAKKAGRACAVVFNESMYSRLTRHLTIESALRRALGTRQLSLAYQPIVELETGRVVSVEALLRWDHPELGMISPAEFVPVAEESGLIVPLGDWVLHEACRQLAAWRRELPPGVPETISVNVARSQLALGPRLLERIREVLAETGLPPGSLQLEVTEREVMRDPAAARALMQDIRALGVKLAMDDFGTGTSSLGCLRDFPFDTVKIDQSFVGDLEESRDVLAVIRATVTLVDNLGMVSIAEGVETAAQVAMLQSVGCPLAQGYYFSRPMPPEALLERLRQRVRPQALATAV